MGPQWLSASSCRKQWRCSQTRSRARSSMTWTSSGRRSAASARPSRPPPRTCPSAQTTSHGTHTHASTPLARPLRQHIAHAHTHARPPTLRHAIAMKANPLAACLVIARDLGMGCEVRTCGALSPPGSSAARATERALVPHRKPKTKCAHRAAHAQLSFCARRWPLPPSYATDLLRWLLPPSSSTPCASASCRIGSCSTRQPRRGATCVVPSRRGCASTPTTR